MFIRDGTTSQLRQSRPLPLPPSCFSGTGTTSQLRQSSPFHCHLHVYPGLEWPSSLDSPAPSIATFMFNRDWNDLPAETVQAPSLPPSCLSGTERPPSWDSPGPFHCNLHVYSFKPTGIVWYYIETRLLSFFCFVFNMDFWSIVYLPLNAYICLNESSVLRMSTSTLHTAMQCHAVDTQIWVKVLIIN